MAAPQMPTSAQLQPLALALHAAGYSVLPLYNKLPYDPHKLPYIDADSGELVDRPRLSWGKFKRAAAPLALVRAWFDPALPADRQPNGVGIVTGAVSGGVQLLDFESAGAFLAWVDLAGRDLVDDLCVVKTGRGFHVFWRAPLARTHKRPDCEARGDDLYVAAPGSWHPAGVVYQGVRGDLATLRVLDQQATDRLVALAVGPLPVAAAARPAAPAPTPAPRHLGANLQACDIRAMFNAAHDVRDLIIEFGGRLAHGRLYHCPASADHANGDAHGSLLVSPSSQPNRYGAYICSCYSPSCRLYGARRRVFGAFDLLALFGAQNGSEAVLLAARRLGQAPRPSLGALPRPQRPGRPRRMTDSEYRAQAAQLADGRDEHGNPRLLLSVAELAHTFSISVRTAQSIETRLRALALWERRQIGRAGSVATVLPGLSAHGSARDSRGATIARRADSEGCNNYQNTPPPPPPILPVAMPQTAKNPDGALIACDFVAAPAAAAALVPAAAAPSTPPALVAPSAPAPAVPSTPSAPAPAVTLVQAWRYANRAATLAAQDARDAAADARRAARSAAEDAGAHQLHALRRKIGPLYGKRAALLRAGEHVPRWLQQAIENLEGELASQQKSHATPAPSDGGATGRGGVQHPGGALT